jgi:hypothetical protein
MGLGLKPTHYRLGGTEEVDYYSIASVYHLRMQAALVSSSQRRLPRREMGDQRTNFFKVKQGARPCSTLLLMIECGSFSHICWGYIGGGSNIWRRTSVL